MIESNQRDTLAIAFARDIVRAKYEGESLAEDAGDIADEAVVVAENAYALADAMLETSKKGTQ